MTGIRIVRIQTTDTLLKKRIAQIQQRPGVFVQHARSHNRYGVCGEIGDMQLIHQLRGARHRSAYGRHWHLLIER